MNFIILFLIYWFFGFQTTIGITTLIDFYYHQNINELFIGMSLYLFGTLATFWHLFIILCYQFARNYESIITKFKQFQEVYTT
jgi:hypothetical protein